MSHIDESIRLDALRFLEYLLQVHPDEVVRNHWQRTLESFATMFGWSQIRSKPNVNSKTNLLLQINVLMAFLTAGLHEQPQQALHFAIHRDTSKHAIPTTSFPFAYLFADSLTTESSQDVPARRKQLSVQAPVMVSGLTELKRYGGDIGRSCAKIISLVAV
ncbi:hypothetical protein CANCADRAFT_30994 [Tortispora caseinolytica NRRL Y-17796]|uniref:Pre-rRNA-processing protein Ipi1 N-terminal domain-containing protein n=1 Tax=Tortispora caseinolytica NRRL Y-17796 TaxID=767744 RepID=A0A1E4TDU1_9ASCO|nr:hypothetical protein CANCADRAFT_30994 [Tortispora caseinolytica NRRL Y-17796]